MTTNQLERPAVELITPIGLEELNGVAALQTRVDRKYVLPSRSVDNLLRQITGTARVLEIDGQHSFGYESTYFDTPDLRCYFDAVRSRPNRFKIRTRTYLDSGLHVLEVKTRDRGSHTIKTRQTATSGTHRHLDPTERAFIAATLGRELGSKVSGSELERFTPSLRTSYQRTTLLVADSRATIDTGLTFGAVASPTRFLPELVIVETKSAGPPSSLDRQLWQMGHRPLKISKYGAGLALSQPYLPANKWNRVLRDHFGWHPKSDLPIPNAEDVPVSLQ